jgi:acetylglutamate kinase
MLVIKYGGNAMKSLELRRTIAAEIARLRARERVVVVHGGGPVIEQILEKLGLESHFIRGLRVTSSAAMDAIEMAITRLSKELAQDLGGAIGLSARDSQLLEGELLEPGGGELGRVGQVSRVNTNLLEGLLGMGITPVIGCMGLDAQGEPFNVNADWVAGAVAGALKSPIIYLSDVDGVYRNYPDPSSLISNLNTSDARAGIAQGWIAGGMIPKVEAALHALERGSSGAILASGMRAGVLERILEGQTGTRFSQG